MPSSFLATLLIYHIAPAAAAIHLEEKYFEDGGGEFTVTPYIGKPTNELIRNWTALQKCKYHTWEKTHMLAHSVKMQTSLCPKSSWKSWAGKITGSDCLMGLATWLQFKSIMTCIV
jgi:hypothetical protein